MSQARNFVFFGSAGAGKGTQIELLQKYISSLDGKDFVYAGTGAFFRKITEKESFVSKRIKDTLDQGRLMPDFFATSIVGTILMENLDDTKHLIADGYPRTVKQADEFMDMMQFFSRGPVDVIYLEITKEESLRRNLLRGRSDDTEESLNRRYDEYVKSVVPAIDYLEKQSGYNFHKIKGEQSIEEVHKAIINSLGI